MKPIIVNAELVSYESTDTQFVRMTFDIKKDDLAGLKFSRPEFVLEITPAETLYEK